MRSLTSTRALNSTGICNPVGSGSRMNFKDQIKKLFNYLQKIYIPLAETIRRICCQSVYRNYSFTTTARVESAHHELKSYRKDRSPSPWEDLRANQTTLLKRLRRRDQLQYVRITSELNLALPCRHKIIQLVRAKEKRAVIISRSALIVEGIYSRKQQAILNSRIEPHPDTLPVYRKPQKSASISCCAYAVWRDAFGGKAQPTGGFTG